MKILDLQPAGQRAQVTTWELRPTSGVRAPPVGSAPAQGSWSQSLSAEDISVPPPAHAASMAERLGHAGPPPRIPQYGHHHVLFRHLLSRKTRGGFGREGSRIRGPCRCRPNAAPSPTGRRRVPALWVAFSRMTLWCGGREAEGPELETSVVSWLYSMSAAGRAAGPISTDFSPSSQKGDVPSGGEKKNPTSIFTNFSRNEVFPWGEPLPPTAVTAVEHATAPIEALEHRPSPRFTRRHLLAQLLGVLTKDARRGAPRGVPTTNGGLSIALPPGLPASPSRAYLPGVLPVPGAAGVLARAGEFE